MAMNILDIIKEDHEKTLDAFEKLEKTTTHSSSTRDEIWTSLEDDLLAHMDGEEAVFYPKLEQDIEDKILEAIEEHNLVRMAMEDLDDTPQDDKRWLAKLKVIKENVEHHIEEEEDDIFKAARKAFGNKDLEDMGKRFKEAKEKISE